MAQLQYITFTVEGSGRFPFDMLRYDSCWPSTSVDAEQLASDYGEPPLRRRKIQLISCARNITPGRWASFNWRVVSDHNPHDW